MCVKDAMRLQAADCFLCCSFTLLNDTIPIICYKTGVATKQVKTTESLYYNVVQQLQTGIDRLSHCDVSADFVKT